MVYGSEVIFAECIDPALVTDESRVVESHVSYRTTRQPPEVDAFALKHYSKINLVAYAFGPGQIGSNAPTLYIMGGMRREPKDAFCTE
jgi:hypothetical protein